MSKRQDESTGRRADLSDAWLGVFDQLALLKAQDPDNYKVLVRELKKDLAHRRWQFWTDLVAQLIGNVFATIGLLAMVGLAWHTVDLGYPTQAAEMITATAGSIVGIFVTARVTQGRHN